MKTLDTIKMEENEYFKNGLPTEFDQGLNDLQREKAEAFRNEHKQAWLGRYDSIIRYKGQKIYNFDYDFIVPQRDEKLITLIKEKIEAKDSSEAMARITRIIEQIMAINGEIFIWV